MSSWIWSVALWRMRKSDSINFPNLSSLFSLAVALYNKPRSHRQTLLSPSCPIRVSDPGDPSRQTSLFMIVLVPLSLSNHPCRSPVWLGSLSTSSCWIKSSVSTLAACQQRSARAACLWKHNSLPSPLSYSNKEELYRERRQCLTSVWSFQR